jgi:FAD/FMN-containing dehydrogenase
MPVTALRDLVSGAVIGSADPEYEDARHACNFMTEARPPAIVASASARDVQAVVGHAVATGATWRSAAAGTACPASVQPTAPSSRTSQR